MLTVKQWVGIGLLLALACTHWLSWDYGRKSGAKAEAKAATKLLAAERAATEQARQEAAKANDKLREALSRPVAGKVHRAVSANPSNCRLPAAVVDSVQQAIREANAAG